MKASLPLDSLILTIRGQKVLLDADLAAIYGVPTKALNQAVKRNLERFPEDFRFQLDSKERMEVVTICDHFPRLKEMGFHVREGGRVYRVKPGKRPKP